MTTSKKFPRPIKLKRMPKTIADAIRLCFALGFRYLWVDSLCIIQNDSQDRQEEASRMQRTYERSSLTIATPICETSSQSFIDQRRLRSGIMKQKARLYPTDSGDFCWLFEPHRDCCPGMWDLESGWKMSNIVLNFRRRDLDAWVQRAWTFQEWMLPPKVLHIHDVTFWDYFEGYGNELTYRKMVPPKMERCLNVDRLRNTNPCEEINSHSAPRRIINFRDRLPALAGIA